MLLRLGRALEFLAVGKELMWSLLVVGLALGWRVVDGGRKGGVS